MRGRVRAGSGPGVRLFVAAIAAVVTGGCAAGSSMTSSAVSPSVRAHAGAAPDYLLRLDELAQPGFTVASAVQPVDRPTLAGGDASLATALGSAGLRSAASARYFRTVATLTTANGPIDVTTTVLQCSTAAGATAAFAALTAHLDAVTGAIPVSTGALGDIGHGDLLEVADQGVTVAQVTLTWRAGDLVSMLVVRERDTGSPVQDALVVAHPQVVRQQA